MALTTPAPEHEPVECPMGGRYVRHHGLMTCPGCTRWVDVDDGLVEPHWTIPHLPLPAGRGA